MRLVSRRAVVLVGIAIIILGGSVAAALGAYRVALVALVALAGIGALQASRAAVRAAAAGRRVEEMVRRVERSNERLKVVQQSIRTSRSRAVESSRRLDLMQRRYLSLAEAERLDAARRHDELLERVTDGSAFAVLGKEVVREVSEAVRAAKVVDAAALAAHGKAVVREVAEALRAESRQIEAMIGLAPRLDARGLLPASGDWALDARSLAHLVDLVSAQRPSLVLELGSGTSTIYLGYLLERWGGRLVSIDHDEHYAQRTRAELARHGLAARVEVRVAPLTEQTLGGGGALWYAPATFEDIEAVDMLLVDGPPGHVAPKARQHALAVLASRLAPSALVLLDDAPRPDEQEIARAWIEEHDLELLDEGVSRIAVLRKR